MHLFMVNLSDVMLSPSSKETIGKNGQAYKCKYSIRMKAHIQIWIACPSKRRLPGTSLSKNLFHGPIYGAPVRQLVVAQIDPLYRRAEQARPRNHRYALVRHPVALYEYLRERLGRWLPPRITVNLASLHDRSK
jgi:hypothetical protein